MSDESVATLLLTSEPLVVIEAAAGCGKTYQGAQYAQEVAPTLGNGRLLILTHTHAACDVFSEKTLSSGRRVEVKTIDALICQIARAYCNSLGLPSDPSLWAWQNENGFEILAKNVAKLLVDQPMIGMTLARRYPVIICDEHQDCSRAQHETVMALHKGGALLRIFGDPLQRIYGKRTNSVISADWARWEELKALGSFDTLITPHRWNRTGCSLLGEWVQGARRCLRENSPIDLTRTRPASVRIIVADNQSPSRSGYQLSQDDRRLVDEVQRDQNNLMVLAGNNELISSLRSFWGRRIPIWEGHTRPSLPTLIQRFNDHAGNPEQIAHALIAFMGDVAVGFTQSSHGNRLCQEIRNNCAKPARGKPAELQIMARILIAQPNHIGTAECLIHLKKLIDENTTGFNAIKIDLRFEFYEAIRLGSFIDPATGYAEISQKRTLLRTNPAAKTLTTVHKSKGMECDNAMLVVGKGSDFSTTHYARCKMYVAISRAKNNLTVVLPSRELCQLFNL